MRFLTCLLLAATLLVGAFFGYGWYGAQMQVVGAGAVKTPAEDAQGAFSELREQLSLDAFYGHPFRQITFEGPENYAFVTLTVRMKNVGLFPMEWISIEVSPDAADIAQLAPEGDAPTLGRLSLGEYTATVLTLKDADTSRTFTVRYYVLGRLFEKQFVM